jgi:hypothetical protein
MNLVPIVQQGLSEPIDVSAEGANQQYFSEPYLFRDRAEIEGHWQLNAACRWLPPTAQDSETTDREIEYHPPWPFVGTPSQKADFELAGPPVSG